MPHTPARVPVSSRRVRLCWASRADFVVLLLTDTRIMRRARLRAGQNVRAGEEEATPPTKDEWEGEASGSVRPGKEGEDSVDEGREEEGG